MAIIEAVFYERNRPPNREKVWTYSSNAWTSREVSYQGNDPNIIYSVQRVGADRDLNLWATQSGLVFRLLRLPADGNTWRTTSVLPPVLIEQGGYSIGNFGTLKVRSNGQLVSFHSEQNTSTTSLYTLSGNTWTKLNDLPELARLTIQGPNTIPLKSEHAYFIQTSIIQEIITAFSLSDSVTGICILKYTPPTTVELIATTLKYKPRTDLDDLITFTAGTASRISVDEDDNIYIFTGHQDTSSSPEVTRFYQLDTDTATFLPTLISEPLNDAGIGNLATYLPGNYYDVFSQPRPTPPPPVTPPDIEPLELVYTESSRFTSTERATLTLG